MTEFEQIIKKSKDTILYYIKKKDYSTSELILEQTLKVCQDHFFYQILSLVKTRLGKIEEADKLYNLLCDKFNNPDDYNNYSIFLKNYNQFTKALQYSTLAVEKNPDKAVFLSNHALVLTRLDKFDEALLFLDKAIELNPNEWYQFANKGCCLAEIGQYEIAEKYLRKSIEFNNCDKQINIDLFHCLAFQKKYQEGWNFYEERYYCYENLINFMKHTNLRKPDSLTKDMKFVVFCEQGVGDNLMYLRFLEDFQNQYPNSYFYCPENFVSIMKSNLRYDDKILPDTEYGISLLSLPFYLNIREIPAPYNIGSYAKHKNSKIKLGICWAGNPAAPMDFQRSTYVEDFMENINTDIYEVYSFQKDKRPRKYLNNDKIYDYSKNLENYKITDLSEKLTDIKSTADIMSELDVFISVDSLPIHIAGSVGLPSYVIVSDKPDWRWGKTDSSSDWYKNIKIVRKEKSQSFKETIGTLIKTI